MAHKVLIGYSTGEWGRRPDFYDALNLLDKPEGSMYKPEHDRSPAKARNNIFQAGLDVDASHILLIDDDMIFRPNALMQLLEHDVDIVSGLYLSKRYPHPPLIFDQANEDTGECLYSYLLGDEPRLKPIVASGFGFILFKTDVFNRLEKPWVRLGELNAEEWCDDIGFFYRVRKAGIKIYADMECQVGHVGSMAIWPNKMEDGKWYTGYNTGGKETLNTPQISPSINYEFKE